MCDMTHSHVWHDPFPCVTLPIPMCDVTEWMHTDALVIQPHACTWFNPLCDMTHCHVRHDSLPCATCLIPMCDMTHSHVWRDWMNAHGSFSNPTTCVYTIWSSVRHDSLPCATWLIPMCDVTHSHVWHDWINAYRSVIIQPHACTPFNPLCDMTHCHVRHDSLPCATWLIAMCDMIAMYGMTHSHVWHDWMNAHRCLTNPTTYVYTIWFYVRHDSIPCVTWLNECIQMPQ